MKKKWMTELTLYVHQLQSENDVSGIDNKLDDISFSCILMAKYV